MRKETPQSDDLSIHTRICDLESQLKSLRLSNEEQLLQFKQQTIDQDLKIEELHKQVKVLDMNLQVLNNIAPVGDQNEELKKIEQRVDIWQSKM